MTPRRRLLAAMHGHQTDYLPCSIYFNPNLQVPGYDLRDPWERVRLSQELGLDPVVNLGLPVAHHPEVTVEVQVEPTTDGTGPVLVKTFYTPAGSLRWGVRLGDDWPHGHDVPFDDHTASNLVEPLLKGPDDVEAFRYVFCVPGSEHFEAHRKPAAQVVERAHVQGLPVQFTAGQGLATLLFAMGAERAVLFALDYPEAFAELADHLGEVSIRRMQWAAELGVDIIKRFGGYEQTNFYNPSIFRTVVLPQLKRETDAARQLDLAIYYRVVTGMTPLLEDIASAGFHCIEGGEPHLGDCSLERWHEAFRGRASSWTGISTPVLLGGNDPEAVTREVDHCIDVFGRRGFILGVTNSIRNHFPWRNTLALVRRWTERR